MPSIGATRENLCPPAATPSHLRFSHLRNAPKSPHCIRTIPASAAKSSWSAIASAWVITNTSQAYPHLAKVANTWAKAFGETKAAYPTDHAAFLTLCHKAGQTKPTPLVLHYEAGGYNCLHQDLYGEIAFPLQMVFLLGQRGRDWDGGEFILVEQQPRAQSKAEVVAADQGQAIIFTTRYRPVKGSRGFYRVNLRHGVSRVHRGTRYTLGIIFHDAK